MRKVLMRKVLLLENTNSPHHITPNLTQPHQSHHSELCSQCPTPPVDYSKPYFLWGLSVRGLFSLGLFLTHPSSIYISPCYANQHPCVSVPTYSSPICMLRSFGGESVTITQRWFGRRTAGSVEKSDFVWKTDLMQVLDLTVSDALCNAGMGRGGSSSGSTSVYGSRFPQGAWLYSLLFAILSKVCP